MNIPFANLSVSQQDSLTYIANENLYMNGDCEKASAGFSEYLKKYPGGAFTTNAGYYAAECALKTNDIEKALQGYEFVISQPSSGFTENALAKAAAILFELHRNQEALDDYTNLESVASRESTAIVALTGQMRCHFLLGNYEQAMHASDNLITRENAGNELVAEAWFIRAKSAFAMDDKSGAMEAFKKSCSMSQSEMAAESQYYIAFILFENEDYKESEKQTFLLVNKYSSYDYWVAKGFILLADIYVKLNNVFQAKQTLQSILDNYEGEDIKAIAREKLDRLNEMELIPAEDVDNKNE
jgi:TolA-binding protein